MVTARYVSSMVLFTDGSLIDGCIGFAFHQTGEDGFGYKISIPAGIFTAELIALFVTLRHIGEVIQPPEKCLIFKDSLSLVKALLSRKISHRTHPLVYECKQMCSNLLEDGIEVEIMWFSSQVGLESNEIVDERA
jgi:ribonuclease HI